jgi:hypothetical protein
MTGTPRPDLRALAGKLTREADDFRRIAVAARRTAATPGETPPTDSPAPDPETTAPPGA